MDIRPSERWDMDVIVRGRHLDVSQRFRDHAAEKVAKLDRFGVPLSRVDVEVTKEANPRLAERAFDVELTCRGAGPVIRAEAAAADKYAALELAYDRLEERLRRAAERRRSARRHAVPMGSSIAVEEVLADIDASHAVAAVEVSDPADSSAEVDVDDDAVYVNGPIVVRKKTHASAPMSVADAVDQMELVGHDFFLFSDEATGLPSVVYRRQSFDYGLIRLTT